MPLRAVDYRSGGANRRWCRCVINGLRSSATNVLLDGAANNDEFGGHLGSRFLWNLCRIQRPDQQFHGGVRSRLRGNRQRHHKSGGNSYHGSAYEINRLSSYGAKISSTKPTVSTGRFTPATSSADLLADRSRSKKCSSSPIRNGPGSAAPLLSSR